MEVDHTIIAQDADFFDSILEFVDARFYFDKEPPSDDAWKRKKPTSKQKERLKEIKRTTKQLRLLPQEPLSVVAVQQRMISERKRQGHDAQPPPGTISSDPMSIDDNTNDNNSNGSGGPVRPVSNGNIDALRERLHARLAQLRTKRKSTEMDKSPKEDDHQTKRPPKKKQKTSHPNATATTTATTSSTTTASGSAMAVDRRPKSTAAATTPAAPATEDDGVADMELSEDVQFSTIALQDGKPTPTYLLNKRKRNKYALLRKAEAQQAKLAALAGTEAGAKIVEKTKWDAALKRAQGVKVKDDPKLLRQAIKKDKKKKAKSALEWKERKKAQEAEQSAKQQQRTENIKAHIQKKKDKRLGITPSSSSSSSSSPSSSKSDKKQQKNRPGFEGKKKKLLPEPTKK